MIGLPMASILERLRARKAKDALRTQASQWEIDAHLVVRYGDPLTVLLEVAEEVRADAVIVGSSASIGHRIAGSLAVSTSCANAVPAPTRAVSGVRRSCESELRSALRRCSTSAWRLACWA